VIYLDTSALIKLYLLEDHSEQVDELVRSQDEPLPVWELQEVELVNALRLKVFWNELRTGDAEHLIAQYMDRKRRGLYYMPEMGRSHLVSRFHRLSPHTERLGCRSLDVLHVACACELAPDVFVSYNERQRSLAEIAGLVVFPKLA
jgi:predicted nucleic acid-binding protein